MALDPRFIGCIRIQPALNDAECEFILDVLDSGGTLRGTPTGRGDTDVPFARLAWEPCLDGCCLQWNPYLEDPRWMVESLRFVVDHTPGHTEGSVTFRTPYAQQDVSEVMFSGDLLFAGSIGRTDLPGGDHPTMLRSLREKVLPLRDDIVVLPGHGEQTSIGRERATNPFLLELLDEGAPTSPVTRGL